MTKVVVAGVCASDKRYERAVVVPVVKKTGFLGYTCSVGISDMHSKLSFVDFILARAIVFNWYSKHGSFAQLIALVWGLASAEGRLIDVGHVENYQGCLSMPQTGK